MKKIHGPYVAKDGRMRVIVVEGASKTTISYPRYLYEQLTGNEIPSGYDIHHKDKNPLNNDLSNLEVIEKKKHSSAHSLKYKEEIEVRCTFCGETFMLTPKQQSDRYRNRNKRKRGEGYFCSKSCSGKFGAEIQNGRM